MPGAVYSGVLFESKAHNSMSNDIVPRQVKSEAANRRLNLRFHGAKDHLDSTMHEYQVCC